MDQPSPESNEAIGRSLRALRKHAGLTLEDVAGLANTSVAYLSKVETGKFAPSRTYVAQVTSAIAGALKSVA
jgi:transcriptional regulator with XRE-family HTH domain